jgi:hypothetical protein
MSEGEKLFCPEEGPRYRILVMQMSPGAHPELDIGENLFAARVLTIIRFRC